MTSAEIPPNSTAQWRAGGRARLYRWRVGARLSSWASAGGREQGRREARQRREVNTGWPKSRELEKEPGERRKEREPGRALRQEQTSSRRTRSHCGKEDKKGEWEGRRESDLRQTRSSKKSEGRVGTSGRLKGAPGEQTGSDREEGTETVAQEMEQRTLRLGLFETRCVGCEFECACV